ncbi:hypothetical protein HJC23_006378 [Cyclotella cryptica]|uniref:Ribosome-binding factor A n=1 Tax=Cyclotella cryptica TaxID=29204 RepID=A0ABD3Q401_9STRA|eukprot:CCRYP_008779-RA/>CCRYP_008779-RA protein AED:0.04 eAED:0.04 QI:0/-1/0/1/-1/1/1/0/267
MRYSSIIQLLLVPCTIVSVTPFTINPRKSKSSFVTSVRTPYRYPRSTEELNNPRTRFSSLEMAYSKYGNGRSSSRYAASDRSKRQERVGHVVRTELATILHKGTLIKNDDDPIEDELRRRINIINADISPDLRQARVTVSIMAGKDRKEDIIAKRRAYAWLVRCTKSIRHALAQKMKHMKASPDVTFVQVDVGAAVDVMQLIEKVSKGYKRDDLFDMELEDDDEDDDEWVDEIEDGEEGTKSEDDDWVDFDGGEEGEFPEVDMENET